QWAAALARHPDMAGLQPSYADDDAGFDAAIAEAELLITWTKVVHSRFGQGGLKELAPKLKTIFCTSAGLDRLAPFAWLPDDVGLQDYRGTPPANAGELGLLAVLSGTNLIPFFAPEHHGGEWAPRCVWVLEGRKLCVVGERSLGGAVVGRAKQVGMVVTGVR